MDAGRSKGDELGWVSDDSPDSVGDPTRVLASRLRISTYPSELTSNHEIHHSRLKKIRFALTNPRGYSALSVQHATPVGDWGETGGRDE
jgi:hypothetical protein